MGRINQRLQGSSLTEAVVSMTIILLVSAIVFIVLLKINKQTQSNKLEALQLAKRIVNELSIKDIENYYNSDCKFIIDTEIIETDLEKGLYLIVLNFRNKENSRKLLEYRKLIVNNQF